MNFNEQLPALFSIRGLESFVILSFLELVLGLDNIIFISLAINKLPYEKRFVTRVTALSVAFVMRIAMLLCIIWISGITTTLFMISGFAVSIRDVLFFLGGAYLAISTFSELRTKKTSDSGTISYPIFKANNHKAAIVKIVIIDMLFSFDSIFTAIGLVSNVIIMALAIGFGMVCMIYLSGKTSDFLDKHPPVKNIALWFVILIGLSLIAQSLHIEISKIYFYGVFALIIMVERIKVRRINQ